METVKTELVVGDSLTDVLTRAPVTAPDTEPAGPEELAALFFTSGTTGPSKAVATTWHYLFSAAAGVAAAWELADGDVVWSAMPLFHLSAAPSVLVPLLLGTTTVLSAAFRPSEVWDDIRACGAAGFAGAGAVVSVPSVASLLAFVNKTYSEAGQVRLASTNYRDEPVVEFNLLSDRRDLDRLMTGFRMLAAIQLSAPLAAVTTDPFPAAYSDKVRKVGVVSEKNRWLTGRWRRAGRAAGAAQLDHRTATWSRASPSARLLATTSRWRRSCARRPSGCGMRAVPAAWAARTIRWRWTSGGRVRGWTGCGWWMPRSSRWCRAPIPTSRC